MSGAILGGPGDCYRYVLTRDVLVPDDGSPVPMLLWVMVNPSTADATEDDHTIMKCLGFANRWGFGRIAVVNLYAYRAKAVGVLSMVEDSVGPDNDRHISEQAASASSVMVAWGARKKMPLSGGKRIARVAALLADAHPHPLQCLGVTQDGDPRHPLMPAYATPRVEWPSR